LPPLKRLTDFGIGDKILVGGIMRYLLVLWLIILMPFVYGDTNQDEYDMSAEDSYLQKPVPPPRADLRWLVDIPTAGMLPRGAFDIDFRTFPASGVQVSLGIGLADDFSIGIGYGGARILSDVSPEWNPKMEFKIRFRLVEETEAFPALALGYSSIGYGLFEKEDSSIGYYEDRYLVKSPGFYLALSKNFNVYLTPVGWHGGISYSFENEIDADPNFFVGLDMSLSYDMAFLIDYDFAVNDNKRAGIFGLGRGYLNLGLSWYITSEISIELDFRDLLLNRKSVSGSKNVIDREVRLVYMKFFSD
jgi:hypothetical protein